MDLSYLPEILSFLIVIGCFRPLARRAGPHANLWFVGFLQIACLLASLTLMPMHSVGVLLLTRWLTDGVGLTFLLASANRRQERMDALTLRVLALPILLQSLVASLDTQHTAWQKAAAAVLILPALFIAFRAEPRRNRQLLPLAAGLALLGIVGPCVVGAADGILFSRFVFTVLLLAASGLYATTVQRWTRSALATSGGFLLWALVSPAVFLVRLFSPGFTPLRTLTEVPAYIACGGILACLLEEHVLRTERMAMHDPLTDLPNRRLFDERLAQALEEAQRTGTTLACLVIDLDNFKHINDTMGHDAGDQILRAVAVRLAWHIGPRDLLARTGGDEFTAMLAGVNSADHLRFVARAMMSAASIPVLIDETHEVTIRLSIGIALSPQYANTASLRRAADHAMYTAKRRGGSLLAVADEEEAALATSL